MSQAKSFFRWPLSVCGLFLGLTQIQPFLVHAQVAETDEDDTIQLQVNSAARDTATILGQEIVALCQMGREAEAIAMEKGQTIDISDAMRFRKHLEKVAYEVAHLPTANYQGAMSVLLATYYRSPECSYGIDALVKTMDNYVQVPGTLDLETLYDKQMLEKTYQWGGTIFTGAMILQMFANANPKGVIAPYSQAKGLKNLMGLFVVKVSSIALGIIEAPQNAGRLLSQLAYSLRATDPKVIARATEKAGALTLEEIALLEKSGEIATEQLPQAGRLSAWARGRLLAQELNQTVLKRGKEWLSKHTSAAALGIEEFKKDPFSKTISGIASTGKAAWRSGGALLGNIAISSATAMTVYGGYRYLGYGEIEAPKEVPSALLFKIQTQSVLDLETQILEVSHSIDQFSQNLNGRYFESPEEKTTIAMRQELIDLQRRHRLTQARWNHFSEENSLFLHHLEKLKSMGLEKETDTSINQTAGVLNISTDLLAKADESLKYYESEVAKKIKKKTR